MSEKPCTTGRCGYGEPCRCDWYANWRIYKPPCKPKIVRGGGYRGGYQDGHKRGYDDGYRDAKQEKTVV